MKRKKLAAAIAAVFAYIKTSEETAASYQGQETDPMVQQLVQQVIAQITPLITQQVSALMSGLQVPQDHANTWGTAGRQSQMQSNSMIQTRSIK